MYSAFKTLYALKIDLFELSDYKNTWNLLSKYELFSLDQANFSSDPSQMLILQYSIPTASLPPSPSLSNFPLVNWNPSSTQSSSCTSSVSYFFIPHLTIRHSYWKYQTTCQAKPIKFIIRLYTSRNALLVKQTTYQKAETLRTVFLSELGNMIHNNSIFNTKCPEFSTKW